MAADRFGLLDTNILILRRGIDSDELPDTMSISAVTLAELSAGPQHAAGAAERARRIDLLQRVESEFDPLPFDAAAARAFGQVTAAVLDRGRATRRRATDLMIASVAMAHDLPLFTTNPDDFVGLDEIVSVVAVTRPATGAS